MIYSLEQAVNMLLDDTIRKFNFITGVCPGYFEKECERLGWKFELDEGYNGWEVDWWGTITTSENIEVNVYGSMYYGTAELSM